MLLIILCIALAFGGLIFFHELGHFAVARAFGMGATTFSLGFGPKLLKKKWGKTEYCLSLVPLGGYVALVGETDENEIPEGFTEEECFSLRPAWQRLLVVLAGPVANIVLALVLCWVLAVFWDVRAKLPEVDDVDADSPAAAAGMQVGDRIFAINGVRIATWEEMQLEVASSEGRPLDFEIVRHSGDAGNGEEATIHLTVTPKLHEKSTETTPVWFIGVHGFVEKKPMSLLESIDAAFEKAGGMLRLTWRSFAKLFRAEMPVNQMGGPIAIVSLMAKVAQISLPDFLSLTALISINLGILNLLPVPVLDGGTIVFCLLEIIFRRPVNKKIQDYAMRTGVVLLVGLMLLATFNDIMRLISS